EIHVFSGAWTEGHIAEGVITGRSRGFPQRWNDREQGDETVVKFVREPKKELRVDPATQFLFVELVNRAPIRALNSCVSEVTDGDRVVAKRGSRSPVWPHYRQSVSSATVVEQLVPLKHRFGLRQTRLV